MAFTDGPCRKLVRERVLRDMLGSVVDQVGSGWKVLIMDSFTTHIMSSTLRMSDLLDAGDATASALSQAVWPQQSLSSDPTMHNYALQEKSSNANPPGCMC